MLRFSRIPIARCAVRVTVAPRPRPDPSSVHTQLAGVRSRQGPRARVRGPLCPSGAVPVARSCATEAFEFDSPAVWPAFEADPRLGHAMTHRFVEVVAHRLQANHPHVHRR